jgi:D-alanine-D-alanine ligase
MHIAILTWWISTEREVALRSGGNMRDWCTIAGHAVDVYDCPSELIGFIEKHKHYDLVIPVFHGIYWEDGQITAFLKTLGCRYAYSDFAVHALCMDKNRTNQVIADIGIKIPRSLFLREWTHIEKLESPLVCYPVIVKPNKWWSSIATSKVDSRAELIEVQKLIFWDDILIQECIEWREFTVGVYYDESGYNTLPIIEIKTLSQDFFDYSEKYETDGSNEVFMTEEDELQKRLSKTSLRVCEYIWIRWVVRLDWRYDGKDIYFLEVNTIPGFTNDSLVPKMWKQAGKSEKEFVGMLVG